MKDIKGKEIKVGDEVAYVLGAAGHPKLLTGKVDKIYGNPEKCTVDSHPNIYRSRILVLGR